MIPDAAQLFAVLQNTGTTIKLFYVKEGAVEKAVQEMPNDVPSILSIMRMYHAMTLAQGEPTYRDVSCLCTAKPNLTCECFNAKHFMFIIRRLVPWPEVRCMHKIGVNRFLWSAHDDMLWYLFQDVLCIIPPLKPVAGRFMEINKGLGQTKEGLLEKARQVCFHTKTLTHTYAFIHISHMFLLPSVHSCYFLVFFSKQNKNKDTPLFQLCLAHHLSICLINYMIWNLINLRFESPWKCKNGYGSFEKYNLRVYTGIFSHKYQLFENVTSHFCKINTSGVNQEISWHVFKHTF